MPTEPLSYEHYEIQTDESGSPLRLGAGGMGTTYRAFDTRLKRVVALKIINNSLLATQESKRRFLNEARAAALLDHPAIARVFHVSDETAQECFFTMELVEGESLGSRVSRYGPLPAGEALLTLRPIAEALGALAERSLVHRDLKPDNIMLVRTGGGGARVKLIDFGLAKSLDDGSAQHFQSVNTGERFIGSVYFASPEQIRPRKGTPMDARSDFYSLGATLWAVLSGFPPFTGTVFEVQEGHVYNDPPWEKISPLPLPLRQLLTRLLAKAPANRPSDAAALLAEWDAAIEGLHEYPTQAALPVVEAVVMEEEGTVLHEGENEALQADAADIVEAEPPFVKSTPAPSVASTPIPAPRPPKKARSPALAFVSLILIAAAALAGWWFGIEQPRQRAASRDRLAAAERQREEEATRRAEAEAATVRAEKQLAAQQEGEKQRMTDAAKKREEEMARAKQADADLAAAKAALAAAVKPIPIPVTATKSAPWTNSLGMKFVPSGTPGVLMCIWETRVQDYAEFVKAKGMTWEKPTFTQGTTHPAVNVSWEDATAFCKWLSEKEGRTYRLPTDAEWSTAVGLRGETGATPSDKDTKVEGFPWGTTQFPPPKGAGNYDSSLNVDSFEKTAPVGSFTANTLGIFDLGGNVWEWCDDWYDTDQTAWVLRGASCYNVGRDRLLSSYRADGLSGYRYDDVGFRCVVGGSVP